jgi:hypothetical protein
MISLPEIMENVDRFVDDNPVYFTLILVGLLILIAVAVSIG